MQYTVNVKGRPVTFTSNMPHDAAFEQLRTMVESGPLARSSFARSINERVQAGGALSPAQVAWVHKLVVDALEAMNRTAIPEMNLSRIIGLLDHAADHLRYPKITISADGAEFRISRATERSREPGCGHITGPAGADGRRAYLGCIRRDGSVIEGAAMTDAVRAALRALALDPAGFCGERGRITGRCVFCRIRLTDERSTVVGYGAICASHYGLPWGAERLDIATEFRAVDSDAAACEA